MSHSSSLEWRLSEGICVPFIEGLPLCSLRNPEGEAERWRMNQKACDFVLILGVGAGFHLKNLNHDKVLIFDPSEELVSRAQRSWPTLAQKITAQADILRQFMSNMPSIWIFRPAFNGRLDELLDLEDFIVAQEKCVGERFLGSMKFKYVQTTWQSFPHRTLKFSIYDFPKLAPGDCSSREGIHLDILRELVK